MAGPTIPDLPALFTQTLDECRELYVSSGKLCAYEYPDLISKKGEVFVQLMDDLHRALVLKVYFSVCEADRQWSEAERFMAEILFEHLWGKRLTGGNLREAAQKASQDVSSLMWYSLIRPFDRIAPLRDRIGALEAMVMRLANLVARADGSLKEAEANIIRSIQSELQSHLRRVPIDDVAEHQESAAAGAQAIENVQAGGGLRAPSSVSSIKLPKQYAALSQASLDEALAELDALIGLDRIKQEVRTLTNYLKLQKRRGEAGLPDTDMSLHMVFTGNPGTGKTTVARILGKILGAMGILTKGHLVETDRSGLVAEYMGQSGPKANAKINEALDGVLFVDEAYSLVSQEGQDAFGSEAIQALLKRSEDDRARLVVILAGYTDETEAMLKSNPGLSSRFNRVLHFEDYSPVEMARIFGWLCEKNHFTLAAGIRPKLLLGLTELHRRRDRHFGNGRAVRNIFELAIRHMANRIADLPNISSEELMRLDAGDIEVPSLPADAQLEADDAGPWRFRVACPGCAHETKARPSFLGRKVRCPKCQHDFLADWGEPVAI